MSWQEDTWLTQLGLSARGSSAKEDMWLTELDLTFEAGIAEMPRTVSLLVWLFLLADGGWWTAGEIIERFPYLNDRVAHNAIWALAHRREGLVVRKVPGHEFQYAATPACKVPNHLSVKDIAIALEKRRMKGIK